MPPQASPRNGFQASDDPGGPERVSLPKDRPRADRKPARGRRRIDLTATPTSDPKRRRRSNGLRRPPGLPACNDLGSNHTMGSAVMMACGLAMATCDLDSGDKGSWGPATPTLLATEDLRERPSNDQGPTSQRPPRWRWSRSRIDPRATQATPGRSGTTAPPSLRNMAAEPWLLNSKIAQIPEDVRLRKAAERQDCPSRGFPPKHGR